MSTKWRILLKGKIVDTEFGTINICMNHVSERVSMRRDISAFCNEYSLYHTSYKHIRGSLRGNIETKGSIHREI
jgi:hypothetical protein